MTLQQLEYILAVDRFRHFAKAAEYCSVTQPTLSTMIQKLEEELDAKIFDRLQQPIVPTPVGIHILEQARKIVEESGRMKQIVEEETRSLKGTFRLGILPTIAPYLLPRFFPQLMRKYPEMDVRMMEMKTADIKKALRHGEIDAGIVALLSGMEDLEQTSLFYEDFCAYVSKGDPLYEKSVVRTADLQAKRQLWMLDEGHCFRDQLVKLCQLQAAKASRVAYHLGSIETFMRMVESGEGVTFIPALATFQLNDWQKELVRPFAVPTPARHIVMITGKYFIRNVLRDVLVKEIKSSVPSSMLSPKPSQIVV